MLMLAYPMRDFIILEGRKVQNKVSEWKNVFGRNRKVKRCEAKTIIEELGEEKKRKKITLPKHSNKNI